MYNNAIYDLFFIYYTGYKNYDPGQVPNGAKCANNSMCVNSKCTSISTPPDHCDCNGHGVCNQENQCHCDIGWAPPDCNTWGLGGSDASNPPTIRGTNLQVIAGKELITELYRTLD